MKGQKCGLKSERNDMESGDAIQKILIRERKARKAAESIIEEKSREIYEANRQLKELNENLERKIEERTREIEESRNQLLEAKTIAEKATLAKSAFLSTMSHEILTPLNGIIGLTELVIRLNQEKRLEEILDNIKFSADNLLAIINQILDFSKIEAGKITFENILFDPRQIVRSVCYGFHVKAKEKCIDLNCTVDDQVPGLLKGDQVKLTQILNNLVGNAMKFTHEGSISLCIKLIDNQLSVCRLGFEVRDTGIGIPENKQASIFEVFSQSDLETTRKYGGTGLGLPITKNLIELQGGTLELKSLPGKGSSFTFALDFLIPTDQEKARLGSAEPGELTTFNKELVLLAEDNKINQFVAATALKNWGLDVDIANNGLEALEMLKAKDYSLILMDLQMPEMDGLRATAEIRRGSCGINKQGIPIIALTANAFSETVEQVNKMGMNGFATKPINQKELNRIITNWINC